MIELLENSTIVEDDTHNIENYTHGDDDINDDVNHDDDDYDYDQDEEDTYTSNINADDDSHAPVEVPMTETPRIDVTDSLIKKAVRSYASAEIALKSAQQQQAEAEAELARLVTKDLEYTVYCGIKLGWYTLFLDSVGYLNIVPMQAHVIE